MGQTNLLRVECVKPTTQLVRNFDHFCYSPKLGWRWLQQICFWALRKIGCHALDEHVFYSNVEFDKGNLIQAIDEQARSVRRFFEKPHMVLLGRDEQARLFREVYDGLTHFQVSAPVNGELRVHNLLVVCVPWMNGMLVMPKVEWFNRDARPQADAQL